MKKTKTLVSSVIAILICFTMLISTTYAWFTDSASSDINVITTGNLDIKVEYTLDGENWQDLNGAKDIFNKGLWEPGHTEIVALKISNEGSLALKYNAQMRIFEEKVGKNKEGNDIVLSEILTLSTIVQQAVNSDGSSNAIGDIMLSLAFNGENSIAYSDARAFNLCESLCENARLLSGESHYLVVKVDMPTNVGNKANHNGVDIPKIEFGIDVIATQFNYEEDSFSNSYDKNAEYPTLPDRWDGAIDVSWCDPMGTEYEINSAEAFAGLSAIMDGDVKIDMPTTYSLDAEMPSEFDVTFKGKTILLNADVDLTGILFDPIGSYRHDIVFSGTFDGQGHTIYNLFQNTWDLDNGYYYSDCGLGLFGAVENATIKNLTLDGVSISGESAICGAVAAVAGDNCVFEKITVKNANIADYQYYAGGLVGWASGKQQYVDCTIDESTTVAAQWGDFDNSIGGLIGGIGTGDSTKITIKNCTVACRIDAYNDVTSSYQWHAYRRAGMLVGNSGKTTTSESGSTIAAAPQLECENVTVIYGDWANYTYCEFSGTSWPYVRVQEGVSNSAYSNPRYGHPTDANGNKVIDDNHVHNEGEDHFIECTFDQLYGGGQGVYGNPTHEGVTVKYNNK